MSNVTDERVRKFLEKDSGIMFSAFPREGIMVQQSQARTGEPKNRIKIYRVGNGALATCIPHFQATIESVIQEMDMWELFSPIGLAELQRAISTDAAKTLAIGFDYTMTDLSQLQFDFDSVSVKPVKSKRLSDTPPSEMELQLPMIKQKKIEAFVIYQNDEKASVSDVVWRTRRVIEIGVATNERYRSRGFAASVVAFAARWILQRGAVAHYGVEVDNIPSIRIARRLGFNLTWQTIRA